MSGNETTLLKKKAETHHPVHDLISERWSPRAFDARPIEPEKIHSLFEAARWAASAANKQPWYFIYATKDQAEEHARIVSTLMDGNVRWAKDAPLLIVAIAKFSEYEGRTYSTFYDLGMASGNLVTQAVELGLVTHQMGGFVKEKVVAELGIPEGYEPLAVIAVGYPGNHELLAEDLRERELAPRTRKHQDEFVFQGRWQ